MEIKNINGYEIAIANSYQLDELQSIWLHLQKDQTLPFFMTWSWISCWLATYSPKIVVVTAKWHNEVVALGLFTCSIESRHGFVRSVQYRLHQMGDPLLDQIWMEYNDFLCVQKHRSAAVNACLHALTRYDSRWNEIILSMMSSSRATEVVGEIKNAHMTMSNPCYAVKLDKVNSDSDSYLASLSSNTRYQIKHSMRLYKELHGELSLTLAKNSEEAIDLFREAGEFHILRWADSGYKNHQFIQFHENLITNSFSSKAIELMKVSAGDTTIGIIYFHIVNRNVYFYLHGLNYESNSKLKPGLVVHALATQHYINQGMGKYDYMGGYSQYKCQLAERTEDLVTLCIQKPSISFISEKMARKVKQLFSGQALNS